MLLSLNSTNDRQHTIGDQEAARVCRPPSSVACVCRGDGLRESAPAQGSYQGTVLQRGSVGGSTWAGTVLMHDGDGPRTPTHDGQGSYGGTVVQHPTVRKAAAPRAFGRGSPLPSTPVRRSQSLVYTMSVQSCLLTVSLVLMRGRIRVRACSPCLQCISIAYWARYALRHLWRRRLWPLRFCGRQLE